jgi:hypothetical protein
MEKSQPPLKGEGAYDYNPRKKDDLIGSGGFGNVFRAIRKHDQQIFAIKISKDYIGLLDDE